MKIFFPLLVAFPLLAAAGPVAAQSPAPQPPATPASQPAERPARLILRLDEIDGPRMSIGRSASETEPKKDLPSLGGDARPVDLSKPRESIFPKESTSNIPTPY